MDLPAIQLLYLEQNQRTLKDHTRDLHLACLTKFTPASASNTRHAYPLLALERHLPSLWSGCWWTAGLHSPSVSRRTSHIPCPHSHHWGWAAAGLCKYLWGNGRGCFLGSPVPAVFPEIPPSLPLPPTLPKPASPSALPRLVSVRSSAPPWFTPLCSVDAPRVFRSPAPPSQEDLLTLPPASSLSLHLGLSTCQLLPPFDSTWDYRPHGSTGLPGHSGYAIEYIFSQFE